MSDDGIISPPKYEQLRRHLYQQIREGVYPINARLPSEEELAGRFKVARGTVRQAIQRLEKEGVVETVHGVGTFARRTTEFSATRMVSFIYTDTMLDPFTNEFYLPILSGAVKEARKHRIKVLYTFFSPEEMLEDEELFFSHIGDGCIIMRRVPERTMARLHENSIPFVLIGNVAHETAENAVIADNVTGGRLATEHLLRLGHRRILHLSHDMDTVSGPSRQQGYLDALAEAGIPHDRRLVIRCDKERRSLYRKLDGLRAKGVEYTAVFAASDHRAILALDYFRDHGIRVPEDVSVIGMDDLSISSHPPYNLTTVRVDKERMGRETVDLMLRILQTPGRPPQTITTDVALVERESCRAL